MGQLLLTVAVLHGQEPGGPRFPAEIRIESSENDNSGRPIVELKLVIEKGVDVWANPVGSEAMKHAAAKVTLVNSDGKQVPVEVDYT